MPSTGSTPSPWRPWSSLLALCAVACAAGPTPRPAPAHLTADALAAYDVSLLDDPVVDESARVQALLRLETLGKPAFAPLVARLGAAPEVVVLDASPYATRLGPKGFGPVTLPVAIEGALYRLLDGGPPPPPDPLTPGPPARFVTDWAAWWAARGADGLPALRAWAERASRAAPRSLPADFAPGRAALPAPRGPPARPAEAAPEDRAGFRALQETLRSRPADGHAACTQIRRRYEGRAALARHVEHACRRLLAP